MNHFQSQRSEAASLDFDRPRTVAFYARITSLHRDQDFARDLQVQCFETQLRLHPGWRSAGIYMDRPDPASGSRPNFSRMLADAAGHKFDLVVAADTHSFSRSAVDLLFTVRQLEALGTEVFFVKENIRSFDYSGQVQLTLMATTDMANSQKISRNAARSRAVRSRHSHRKEG